MAYEDLNSANFVDTTPQTSSTDQYEDGTHIPNENKFKDEINAGILDGNAKKLATWIRTKRYGIDVREALALFVEWINVKFNGLADEFNKVIGRVDNVEKRQTSVETDFKDVVANATVDSEVIIARSNNALSYKAKTLDDLLEYMGGMIAKYVPAGYDVDITHNLGKKPVATAWFYQYAFDTEPNGFGTQTGEFGGTVAKTIPVDVSEMDPNTSRISLPIEYKSDAVPFKSANYANTWYLFNTNDTSKVVKITLS